MTQHEWLSSEDPATILRLRRTECCGCFWRDNGNETVSLWLDCTPCGQCDHEPIMPVTPFSDRKLRLWVEACRAYWQGDDRGGGFDNYDLDSPSGLITACENWSRCHPIVMPIDPLPLRANFLRDIIGNPFRPVQLPIGAPVEAKCKCGGALAPLKRDRQPMLSACLRCGQVNGHWFDVLKPGPCPWLTTDVLSIAQAAYEERRRKCEACHGTGNGYHVRDHYIHLPSREFCLPCQGTGYIDDGTLDPVRLMILADALEEAGCDDEIILDHLRGVYGCDLCEGAMVIYETEALSSRRQCPKCSGEGLLPHPPHVRGCWALDLILRKE